MQRVQQSMTLPYQAEALFALVNDLQAYPAFLPWCQKATIQEQSGEMMIATLQVAKGPFQHSFTTCNQLEPYSLIKMNLVDGPFRHLEGFWRFESVGKNHCDISFELEFEFSNKVLALALGPVFQGITISLVKAFAQRAEEIF